MKKSVSQMASALGVSLKFDEKARALMDRYKMLAAIDKGQLPSVAAAILLTRGEVCHFTANDIAQKEIRTVTTRVNYGGVVASVKIMKGVRYRFGSRRNGSRRT